MLVNDMRGEQSQNAEREKQRRIRRTLIAFLALSVFMYVSITYKIIYFGP